MRNDKAEKEGNLSHKSNTNTEWRNEGKKTKGDSAMRFYSILLSLVYNISIPS